MPEPFIARNLRDHPTELLLGNRTVVVPARAEVPLSAADRMMPQVRVLEGRRVLDVRRRTRAIDLNTATAEQLEALPDVGPVTARAIAAHRTANGPFARLDELAQVSGVGPRTVAALAAAADEGLLALRR